jgi:hypothetical protein
VGDKNACKVLTIHQPAKRLAERTAAAGVLLNSAGSRHSSEAELGQGGSLCIVGKNKAGRGSLPFIRVLGRAPHTEEDPEAIGIGRVGSTWQRDELRGQLVSRTENEGEGDAYVGFKPS